MIGSHFMYLSLLWTDQVPWLPLHGIQFRRTSGDGWQYHMLARRVLTELKLWQMCFCLFSTCLSLVDVISFVHPKLVTLWYSSLLRNQSYPPPLPIWCYCFLPLSIPLILPHTPAWPLHRIFSFQLSLWSLVYQTYVTHHYYSHYFDIFLSINTVLEFFLRITSAFVFCRVLSFLFPTSLSEWYERSFRHYCFSSCLVCWVRPEFPPPSSMVFEVPVFSLSLSFLYHSAFCVSLR